MIGSGGRQLQVVCATFLLVAGMSFAGGATSYALFVDTETADAVTIQIEKKNQGPVTFSGCDKVTFEPANTSDFTFNVTTGQATYDFDETDFNTIGGKTQFQVKAGSDFPSGEQIVEATLDGTTYSNPNYPC